MNPYSTELCHHGILGQRWGKKNGPPYPLDAGDHSASEKKAGWKKSLKDNAQALKTKYDSMSDRNKTIAKRAGVAAAALTAVSIAQTGRNVAIQNVLQEGYGKVPISTVVKKGTAAAGRAAAIGALTTVGAHKIKDYWNNTTSFYKEVNNTKQNISKKELTEYRKQKIAEAPSTKNASAHAATKGWWKNMPEANLKRHYAEEKALQNVDPKVREYIERHGY